MRIYEKQADGKLIESKSMRLKYETDENGNMKEVYEKDPEISILLSENIIEYYSNLAEDAIKRIKNNKTSPLEYFMFASQMEIDTLSDQMGLSKRVIKKHFNPKNFEKLDEKILTQYADLFLTSPEKIKNFKRELK